MAVAWPKILTSVTVPTGDWTWGWTDGGGAQTVTVAAQTCATPLHLGEQLQIALRALGGGHSTDTVVISAEGLVTVTINGMTSTNWGGTSDDFSAALGFDETETVSAGSYYGNDQCAYGWYPGIKSFATWPGTASVNGAGMTADSGWSVADKTIRTIAGTGAARLIAPARRAYSRRIKFDPIHRDEIFGNRLRSPMDFLDRWATNTHWWYLDRDDGSVGSYGTQIDPGDSNYEMDTDGNYFKVTLLRDIEIEPSGKHPDWFSVSLEFNVEPK